MEMLNCYNQNVQSGVFNKSKQQSDFMPYENNQGSVVAVSGEDFAIIASDTRLSSGFSIYTREQPKLTKLSDVTVLGCTGCWCDVLTFTRILQARMQMYEHEHNKLMTTPAVAQLMTSLLYYKRFFPYYVFNILAGLDQEGKGCVYSYDSIGHCERASYRAVGSSCQLLQPLLDNQVGYKNMEGIVPPPLTLEKAVSIIKDVFQSAAERDIYTGDGIFMNIITKSGIEQKSFPLRKD